MIFRKKDHNRFARIVKNLIFALIQHWTSFSSESELHIVQLNTFLIKRMMAHEIESFVLTVLFLLKFLSLNRHL